MRQLLALALLIITADVSAADLRDPGAYTRVLIPFHMPVSGAGGVWLPQWWFRNDAAVSVDAFPLATVCGLPPPATPQGVPVFVLQKPALPGSTTITCLAGDVLPSFPVPPFVPIRTSAPGAFLYIETTGVSKISIAGRLSWQSAGYESPSAMLRATPETAFLSGPRSIMPVPVRRGTRFALRLYALPESASDRRVNIYIRNMQPISISAPGEEIVAAISVDLSLAAASVLPCLGSCDIPPVTFIPATAEVFNIVNPEALAPPATLRVEVMPSNNALKWWGILSITDTATNTVELYEATR